MGEGRFGGYFVLLPQKTVKEKEKGKEKMQRSLQKGRRGQK